MIKLTESHVFELFATVNRAPKGLVSSTVRVCDAMAAPATPENFRAGIASIVAFESGVDGAEFIVIGKATVADCAGVPES